MGVGSSFGSFPGGGGTGGSCIGVGLGVRSGGWIGGRFLSGSGGGSTGGRRVKKTAEILRISWDMRLLTALRKHAHALKRHLVAVQLDANFPLSLLEIRKRNTGL
jgi:hypothetical protein